MAGELENNVLDMSAFDMTLFEHEEIKEESPPTIVQETNKDITDTVDEQAQENVDNQEEEKSLEEKVETTDSPANSDNVFEPLAEFLKEQGFFSTLEKPISTAEDLAEAFKAEIKKNEYANLSETQIEYLKALESGVPDEVFHEHLKSSTILNGVTEEMLEDESVRKQVIINDLVSSGIDQTRAEKQYQRIYELGESYEESKIALDNLKQKDTALYNERVKEEQEKVIQREKLEKKQLEDLKEAVYNQDKLFGSLKVTDGLKNQIYELMTKPVDYTETGLPLNKLMKQRLENPVEFETALYSLFALTDGFKNIDKLVVKSTTTAAKKLRDAVTNSTLLRSGGEGNYGVDSNEYSSPIVDIEI